MKQVEFNKITRTREMTDSDLERIKPYTKSWIIWFWGQEYKVLPTVVHTVFGDAGSLISLDPTNSRPWFYLILVDSNIQSQDDALRFIGHNENLVFNKIIDEYGDVGEMTEEEVEELENLPDSQMALDTESGYSAGYFEEFGK